MARKRRKLYGAAAAAHARKVGRSSNPRRRRRSRRRSMVVVNRVHRRRHSRRSFSMNPIPRLGNLGKSTVDVATLGAALLASMAVTAFATKQAEQHVSFLSSNKTVNFIGKVAVAAAVVGVSRMLVKNPRYHTVILAGAFAPVLVDIVEMFMPQVAAAIPVLGTTPALPAPAQPSGSQPARNAPALSAMLRARLNAELEDDQSYIMGY